VGECFYRIAGNLEKLVENCFVTASAHFCKYTLAPGAIKSEALLPASLLIRFHKFHGNQFSIEC
jgi:hypothetical protein